MIFETKAKYVIFYIVIVGDVNSRIGNEQDFISDDDISFSQIMDYYPGDLFNINRKSRDDIVIILVVHYYLVSQTGCTYFKWEKW